MTFIFENDYYYYFRNARLAFPNLSTLSGAFLRAETANCKRLQLDYDNFFPWAY